MLIASSLIILALFFVAIKKSELSFDRIIAKFKFISNGYKNNNNKKNDKTYKKNISLNAYTGNFDEIQKAININKTRTLGNWTPIPMKFNNPEPYPNWSVKDTKPLPYRPFKHIYHVTMGIRSVSLNDWIELDNHWIDYHQRKLERFSEQENGEKNDKNNENDWPLIYATSPEAYDAVIEALNLLVDYLIARYPSLFAPLYESQTNYSLQKGIRIILTDETFDISESLTKSKKLVCDPMKIIGSLIQDDVAILLEGKNGNYYLKAGCIALAGFWRLRDKLNMSLSEIHTSGNVPQYESKLKIPMERFFTRIMPDKPVARNNYFVQLDDDVAWSHAIGSESSQKIGWYTAKPADDISKLMFRSERQTVRRLPNSGAILFTIRTYFHPIISLANEPYVPGRLLDGFSSWSDDVAEYKGLNKFKTILFPYLAQKHKEQIKNGLDLNLEPSKFPF